MKFKGKYNILINEAITRYQQGGLLSGDLVRFRKDTFNNPKVKEFTNGLKEMIVNAMNTDLNLKVGSVKSIRPNTANYYSGGLNSGTDAPTDYWVDVVVEYAPGLWKDPITVPMEVLELVDTNGQMPKIPDSLKRKSKITKKEEVKTLDKNRRNPMENIIPIKSPNAVDGRSSLKKPTEYKRGKGKLTLEEIYTNNILNKPMSDFVEYTIKFSEPYGKNAENIIKKIQTMPNLSNNMDAKFIDDNTLLIKTHSDIEPSEFENMLTNIVNGTVKVSK